MAGTSGGRRRTSGPPEASASSGSFRTTSGAPYFAARVAGERLRIPAEADFNIEHERSGGQNELEFQLRWREGG